MHRKADMLDIEDDLLQLYDWYTQLATVISYVVWV